jgi:hypothetical protein
MAALPPTATMYAKLYADPSTNPFGMDEDTVPLWYSAVYEVWRSTHDLLSVEALHNNILADYSIQLSPLECLSWTTHPVPAASSFPVAFTAFLGLQVTYGTTWSPWGMKGMCPTLTFTLMHFIQPSSQSQLT